MFDADAHGHEANEINVAVTTHIAMLAEMIEREDDCARLAAAAVMLAVSLGYSPGEIVFGD